MTGVILDRLSENLDTYISNLKTLKHDDKVISVLKDMDYQMYSLEEWNYALSYLMQDQINMDNAKDAYDFALRYYSK